MRTSLLAIPVLAVLVAACGSNGGSSFDPSMYQDDSQNGSGNPGSGDQFNGSTGGDAGSTTPQDIAQCATANVAAEPVPVNLVFIFDQSGSMGGGSIGVKWNPVTSAMKSFFSDPNSKGTSASLQYFPIANNECDDTTYKTPEVALTALPNATSFAQSFANHSPNGGTPTLPALNGAIQYAQQVKAQKPNEAVAIVLVTDGEPNDCNSTIQGVSAAASGAAANKLNTYVIGVGSATQNLDAIASAGGTSKAIIVDANNGTQANADFMMALQKIRGSVLACDYSIPAPPAGQTLDISKVNVVYTPSGGQSQTLTYNKDCTGGTGWHYDNASAPSKIVLCQSTCDGAKQTAGAVQIAFGCSTKGGVVK